MLRYALRTVVGVTGIAAALVGSGCGTVRETLPARSAMEQLLLSSSADRCVKEIPVAHLAGKNVFLDTTNLDCTDKGYVIEAIRATLRSGGIAAAPDRESAEVVLEVASGALSLNKRDVLFGFPAIPVPMPFVDETVKLPELPLYKHLRYTGHAKLIFSAADAETGKSIGDIPICYGTTFDRYLWVMFTGPYRKTDLPEEAR